MGNRPDSRSQKKSTLSAGVGRQLRCWRMIVVGLLLIGLAAIVIRVRQPEPQVGVTSSISESPASLRVGAAPPPPVMPLTITHLLQVPGVAIHEAHGGFWSLSAADGTVMVDVHSHNRQLTRVHFSVWHPVPGEHLATDAQTIKTLLCQIIPNDPWFAGEWFETTSAELTLPATVSHEDYTLTLNVGADNSTQVVLTPSQTA